MIPTGKARVAGIIGWPVGHSRSPRLHGYWLDKSGIDGAYVPLPVRPEHFAEVMRALPRMGMAGVNITVPHKETVLSLLDVVDEQARRIGAVNTVVIDGEGCMHGRNTDASGFIANIRAARPDWRAEAGAAVVLGAGGAARAVCAALVDAGALEVRVVNRTADRALRLARDIGGPIVAIDWKDRAAALAGAGLLVNSTTLGMTGADQLDIDLARLPAAAVVNDIVYSPLETPLLRAAARRGNPTVDGLGMLLHQARPAFAAWFGVEPEVTAELRGFVLAG